jgi:hypothetical protein
MAPTAEHLAHRVARQSVQKIAPLAADISWASQLKLNSATAVTSVRRSVHFWQSAPNTAQTYTPHNLQSDTDPLPRPPFLYSITSGYAGQRHSKAPF